MREDSRCVLCNAQASRSTLLAGDGYLYECPACGGAFEIGSIAHRRAEQGVLHRDVVGRVRSIIATGAKPRVEFTSGELGVFALPGKAQSDVDDR